MEPGAYPQTGLSHFLGALKRFPVLEELMLAKLARAWRPRSIVPPWLSEATHGP